CLDRMSEVASSGRTVLFVSHNFAAVTALTRRAIVLRSGHLTFDGPVEAALAHYSASLGKAGGERDWGGGTHVTLLSAQLLDERGQATERFVPGTPLRLRVALETSGMTGMSLDVVLRNEHNLAVAYYSSNNFSRVPLPTRPGRYECTVALDAFYLASG